MIESIRIENLGTIRREELNFASGFTVITGETGAGKTMLLTSLDWLLGAKAEASLISRGSEKAVVEGSFWIHEDAEAIVREAGGDLEEGGAVEVARVVPAQSRSRAHLGGRTVPAAVLARLGAQLVSVHGQSAQLRLRSEKAQREALDSFADETHRKALDAYHQTWSNWQEAELAYQEWCQNAAARENRRENLEELLCHFVDLKPQANEFDELAAKIAKLSNVESLREHIAQALGLMAGEEDSAYPGASDQVSLASNALQKAAAEDPSLEEIVREVESASYVLADAVRELETYLCNLNADPQLLAELLSRRAALRDLARKAGVDPNNLERSWQETNDELAGISGGEARLQELQTILHGATAALEEDAKELSACRERTAVRLGEGVNAELAGLDMADTQVSILINPVSAASHGADQVQFMLQSHPKAPVLPLAQAASGGELSRLMLALEVTLAGKARREPRAATSGESAKPSRTFVFDEVDAGIGGQAGIEVGRRLQRLAQEYQVIAVTHLAQVAAFADQQIQVEKVDGESQLVALDPLRRREELARMISGNKPTKTALQHADELLRHSGMGQS